MSIDGCRLQVSISRNIIVDGLDRGRGLRDFEHHVHDTRSMVLGIMFSTCTEIPYASFGNMASSF